eukprot:NODE_85_length_22232_cov_1.318619.p2 type:complete len:810 gc:universal NODE_85_length_22232_cov_1.318619:9074-6645(-)
MEFTFPASVNRSGTIKKKIRKLQKQGIQVEIKDNKIHVDKRNEDAQKFFEGQLKKYEISLRHEKQKQVAQKQQAQFSPQLSRQSFQMYPQAFSSTGSNIGSNVTPNFHHNYYSHNMAFPNSGNQGQNVHNFNPNSPNVRRSGGGLINMVKGKELDHNRIYNDMRLGNIEKIRDDFRRDKGLLGVTKVRGAVVSIPQKKSSPNLSANITSPILPNRSSVVFNRANVTIEDPRRSFIGASDDEPNSPSSAVSVDFSALNYSNRGPLRHTMSFEPENFNQDLISSEKEIQKKKKKKKRAKKEKHRSSAIMSYYASETKSPDKIQNNSKSQSNSKKDILIDFSPVIESFPDDSSESVSPIKVKSAQQQKAELYQNLNQVDIDGFTPHKQDSDDLIKKSPSLMPFETNIDESDNLHQSTSDFNTSENEDTATSEITGSEDMQVPNNFEDLSHQNLVQKNEHEAVDAHNLDMAKEFENRTPNREDEQSKSRNEDTSRESLNLENVEDKTEFKNVSNTLNTKADNLKLVSSTDKLSSQTFKNLGVVENDTNNINVDESQSSDVNQIVKMSQDGQQNTSLVLKNDSNPSLKQLSEENCDVVKDTSNLESQTSPKQLKLDPSPLLLEFSNSEVFANSNDYDFASTLLLNPSNGSIAKSEDTATDHPHSEPNNSMARSTNSDMSDRAVKAIEELLVTDQSAQLKHVPCGSVIDIHQVVTDAFHNADPSQLEEDMGEESASFDLVDQSDYSQNDTTIISKEAEPPLFPNWDYKDDDIPLSKLSNRNSFMPYIPGSGAVYTDSEKKPKTSKFKKMLKKLFN